MRKRGKKERNEPGQKGGQQKRKKKKKKKKKKEERGERRRRSTRKKEEREGGGRRRRRREEGNQIESGKKNKKRFDIFSEKKRKKSSWQGNSQSLWWVGGLVGGWSPGAALTWVGKWGKGDGARLVCRERRVERRCGVSIVFFFSAKIYCCTGMVNSLTEWSYPQEASCRDLGGVEGSPGAIFLHTTFFTVAEWNIHWGIAMPAFVEKSFAEISRSFM